MARPYERKWLNVFKRWPSLALFLSLTCLALLQRLFLTGTSGPGLLGLGGIASIDYLGNTVTQCILPDGTFKVIRVGPQARSAAGLEALKRLPRDKCSPVPKSASLPLSGDEFAKDNGTKWKIEYVGNISFTGELASKNLVGDKCRSSVLGKKVIWNCGDMWCNFDYTICGFAMGPAMYGTKDVMTINTDGIQHIYKNDFLKAWEGDVEPQAPSKYWGMDTSNVAAINDTHGVAYGNQVWRGTGEDVRQGSVVASVTLGHDKPIATRYGPPLTGPNAVELGMLAILRAGDYIYIYSVGGPSKLLVTRVGASDDVFDKDKYESLEYNTTNTWTGGIPQANTTEYGMVVHTLSGQFGCMVYGSVFYSNYFNKYVILCNIFMVATNFFTSDTPYGPWSDEYGLLRDVDGYGSMAHPSFSPHGSHKELFFSQGPNDGFNMFKITFIY